MDFEQYFAQTWKTTPSTAVDSEKASACFDCNICLDFARDPVVTLCGHLYCWPCIYKWFHIQNGSISADERPKCPVCKAEISPKSVIPLYGRGQNLSEGDAEGKAPNLNLVVPPRPPASGMQSLTNLVNPAPQLPHHNSSQDPQNFADPHTSYVEGTLPPPFSLGSSTAMAVFNPVVEMFGEMVYARVFGNPESLYAYPNSFHLEGSISPRLRRQEIQADKSLNRISVFLFCCFLLCLILF